MSVQHLTEDNRREIFRLLVTGQDMGMSVEESRQMAMKTYGLTTAQVVEIEREGMAAGWPPL